MELLKLFLRLEDESQERIDFLFNAVNDALKTGQDRWKETILISVGHMTKYA